MLWCGIKFGDHESLLRHLKDCSQLSASEYWCPCCHRAESFASNKIPEPLPGSDNQSPFLKKHSLLKRFLRKRFSRKRATDPREDPPKITNPSEQELHSNHILEMWGLRSFHREVDATDYGGDLPQLEAGVETYEKQRDTFGSPYKISINSAPIEKDSWNVIPEKDGNSITHAELPTCGSHSFSDSGAELPLQSQPKASMRREVIPLYPNESSYTSMSSSCPDTLSGQPDPQSYIGRHIPVNAPTGFSQSNVTSHLSNPVPNYINPEQHSFPFEYGPPYTQNLDYDSPRPARQDHSRSQIDGRNSASGRLDYQHIPFAPRSTPVDYGSPHTQNLDYIGMKSKMDPQLSLNTINFLSEDRAQIFPHSYPNPWPGPENSPRSASSNETNNTGYSGSQRTALTPATPFSVSASPISISPQDISDSPARSSGILVKKFRCQTCGKSFTDQSNRKRHEKTLHGDNVRFPCIAGCGKTFSRSDNRPRHYQNDHPTIKRMATQLRKQRIQRRATT